MTAELIGFDMKYFQRLIKIDGKKEILGSEKTHVRCYYEQIIAIPTKKAFEGLEQKFQKVKDKLKVKHPLLFFVAIPIKIKNIDKFLLIAHSLYQEDFIESKEIISELFTPKFLKLQPH